ncbi:MAG TPA: hypothetical protein VH370_27695 [Humisphaera sp.]|jgi:hypothetical protein|nr:hypothetical protein [Humisphaera sp.]
MAFLSPLWLLALLPWAALTTWLLRGRRPRVRVPFLHLWRGPLPLEIRKRGWRTPPIWLALALLTLLAAILGASQPMAGRSGSGQSMCVIVDSGMSMSAMDQGVPRFLTTTRRTIGQLPPNIPPQTSVDLIVIPAGGWQTTLRDLPDVVASIPVSAIDSRAAVIAAVQNQLASGSRPVIVVSDEPLGIASDRLVQVYPSRIPDDVGIIHLAASESARPQVMFRLRNESSRKTAPIRISSGTAKVERDVELPPNGQERDYFIDMNELGEKVIAELTTGDDQPANDRRWLVREGSNPRIEIRAPVSPSLRRMLDVYTKNRPPDAASRPLAIVGRIEDLPADSPGIVVATNDSMQPARGPIAAVDHPVTQNVNWSSITGEFQMSGNAPQGWTTVLSTGGKVMVAVQEGAIRRAWIGFDQTNWPGTTDFVIFWANVLNWCAAGAPHFVSHPLADWRDDWKLLEVPAISPPPAAGQWPGIYRSPDGADHALNAPNVRASAASNDDWKARLAAMRDTTTGGRSIAHLLMLLAVGLIAAAALTLDSQSRLRKTANAGSTM